MNFTVGVKRELLQKSTEKDYLRAVCSAFLRTGGFISWTQGGLGFILITESERIAEYFTDAFERLYGISCAISVSDDRLSGREKLTLGYYGEKTFDVLSDLGIYRGDGYTSSLPDFLKDSEAGRLGYVRGAFLGSGSCTVPRAGAKTGYHLEFVFSYEGTAQEFAELLSSAFLIETKILKRKGKFVVYIASLAVVSDFLAVVGAYSSLTRLNRTAEQREENNNGNRVNNCFVGNMDRSATAAARLCVQLARLQREGVLDGLDEELRRTAEYRLSMPEATLNELAQALNVSKSGVNHRLRKLTAIYEETHREKEKLE